LHLKRRLEHVWQSIKNISHLSYFYDVLWLLITGEAEGLLAKANAKASAVRVVADAIAKQVC